MDKFELVLKSGNTIKATAKQGNKAPNWSPSGEHYRIRVTVAKKSFSFDFWDSYHNMIEGLPCDVRGALCSWASDAFAGMNTRDVDDIAEEFGYTKPSEALRVFKGVKKAERQFDRSPLNEEDLQELSDY